MKCNRHLLPTFRRTWLALPAMLPMCLMIVWNYQLTADTGRKSNSVDFHTVNVAPTGWRRTVNGWELAEFWGMPPKQAARDINQWIAIQEKQEASMAQMILYRMRDTHPLVFSTSLLLVVVVIAMTQERKRQGSSCLRMPHESSSTH